jgi:hypothetical protein
LTSGKRARERRRAAAPPPRSRSQAASAWRGARLWVAAATALALAAFGIAFTLAGRGSNPPTESTASPKLAPLSSLGALKAPGPPGPAGPEGVPIPAAPPLAGTSTIAAGDTVDGIQCQTSEQVAYHIHAHLTIFVRGAAREIPYGIGIPGAQTQNTSAGPFVGAGSCFYWLHAHAADGIIHIESPSQRVYTLGDFFDVWGQPLGRTRVGPATGPVTAIYDGKVYEGNPRNIPLSAHAQIQLDVGRPLVAPVSISFPNGL